ncbi:MFS transporter [Goodfellowiella coeruleoviolacea]|uniref:Major Facilitator Superfamily protein n=1 Tax=Goodfellowiella coeruleoviolacea TaxID=334858 RepID=A0AAE3GD68_9PSEU|nr:MFS transporter [Goodfellowiella coeruleoviolacea]MCP2165240.1 Major Facilitator Superfamily protein [Goodfellowiella coeruleoviolacea]
MVLPTRTRHPGVLLAVLLSAQFLAQFDFFVVNVTAPALHRDLGAGPTALELIVGGYAFTYAAGMITGGRLGDLVGHRRVFVLGMLAFTVTTLLCGLAANPAQLVLARLAQGLAGAVMVPQVLAVITRVFPADARAAALGWYGVAGGVGSIAGQVFGGLLLRADVLGLGWRVVFLVAVPVGAIAAVLAARLLPSHPDPADRSPADRSPAEPGRRTRLDLPGALGVAGSLALVLVPLAMGRTQGWPAWTWLCLAATLPVAVLTGRRQRRLSALGGQPVLELSLFRVPSYTAGLIAGVAFMGYFASFMFTLTLLLQGGLGLGALGAGLVFAPMGLLYTTTSLLGARLVARHGRPVMVFGGCVTAAGLLLLALRLLAAPQSPGLAWVLGALALVGVGNGLVLPQLVGAALVGVRPHQAGIGAGMLTTTQQFAGSAGVALIGALFFAVAGDAPTGTDYAAAMTCSALVDLALILVVVTLVAVTRRASRRAAPHPVSPR